ncbi:MAG: hypothetical protein K2I70_00380 [Bacilli bacterium]|nr:hypothetical protein [Bacilli bacterium]
MEEIIKELEEKLSVLKDQEEEEICTLAFYGTLAKTLNEVDRRIEEASQKGERNAKNISNNIRRDFRMNPDAFIGLTDIERQDLFARCEDRVKECNLERSYTMHILRGVIDYMNLEEPQIFLELDKLADALKYINLQVNSQIKIFSYIIGVNSELSHDLDDSTFVPNVNALVDYEYKYMDQTELRTIFSEHRFDAFMEDEEYENKRGKEEVKRRYEETKLDFTARQQACITLDALLSRDYADLTEDDYKSIVECMNELFFGHIAYRVVKILKKNKEIVSNGDTSEKTKDQEETKIEEKVVEKSKIKQRELKSVYHEIGKLYDLENFKAKKTLALYEIIYILSLMYSIHMNEEVIAKFLTSEMHKYQKNNPFVIFYESYDKFASLSDNPNIKKHLEMLEYILTDFNLFICSNEKYAETKQMVDEEIKAINDLIGNDYTYEKERAKKLLLKSEE